MSTLWISHRGESYDAPENTLPAFALSLERNTDGMECDIHFTCDNKLVCSHDAHTGRTGDRKLIIGESTFEELQQIDVCNHKEGFINTRIPLFTDTLQYLGKDRVYYVEIKGGDLRIVPELIRIIDNSSIPQEQFVMISFDDEVVKLYKEQAPDKKAYLLLFGEPAVTVEDLICRLQACNADGVDIGCSSSSFIDQEYADKLHVAGFDFAVWTVDTPELAGYFLDLGVDAITSNRAAWLMDMYKNK